MVRTICFLEVGTGFHNSSNHIKMLGKIILRQPDQVIDPDYHIGGLQIQHILENALEQLIAQIGDIKMKNPTQDK